MELELDQKINQAIDKAIEDYFKIAKMKRVSWKTLNKRHMNYGLCTYFIRNCNLELNWDAIPNRPYYEQNLRFGWIYPKERGYIQYCQHWVRKPCNPKKCGFPERFNFLVENQEIIKKHLKVLN